MPQVDAGSQGSTNGRTVDGKWWRVGWGPVLCAMAAVLWSTSALFARSPLFDPWPVEHRGAAIALWRAVFALVILVPLIRRLSWDWRMVPMAGAFALMNWTYLTALVGGPPENAIWLQNLAPAWVMLVAVVVLREPTVRKDWWMLSLCIGGVIFILALQNASPMTTARHYWWAPWLAIASGICYAGVILSLRSLRSHDPAWLIALNHAVTALLMCPLVWNSGVGWPQENMWFLLAGIGMIQMGTPYLLFARGLKSTPSHLASLITLLEPVLLPVWVFLARGSDPDYEPAPWWTWVGASMILLGLMIRYWPVPIDGARPHGRSRSQGEP